MKKLLLVLLLAHGYANASDELLRKNNCTVCHATNAKIVGPSFVDISKKYQNDKDAVAKLTKKVKQGGSGVWGNVPMPAHPQISDSDLKTIVTHVLKQK